tara:strand:- start:3344 stop:4039 length:696 start_codon:yes stop_codon:yes gene_type:complete
MKQQELVNQQIEYFKLLTSAIGSPLYIFDGYGHENYFGRGRRVYSISQKLRYGKPIQDVLRYDAKQIVFDDNFNSWELVRDNGNKIIDYLNKKKIPYEIIITGGRGIRINVYLDSIFHVTQERIFYVYCYLCNQIGIDWKDFGIPENKSKNHLLGTIGKVGKTGYYSTYTKELPFDRPKTLPQDIKFPKEIKVWGLPRHFLYAAIAFGESIPKKEIKKANIRYDRGVLLRW